MLRNVVETLEDDGFLKERLGSLRYSGHGAQTYLGLCQLEPDKPCRRLDIKVYPRSQFAFAILYFTGSAHFNRSMRLFA
jgi:DNA polymerase lambda